MSEPDDLALLREYAAQNSESAFADLVSRRVDFVYSAALRQTRDPHLAEEITQAVFILLAQKAGKISDKTILTGWLFKTTRFTALAQIRAETKRARQQKEFQMESEVQSAATDELWNQMSPLLDEALAALGETDRQAVLLRFFENKSLAEVGKFLGIGEDTARKRVSRALEKLHRHFNRRGVRSTTAIIAGAISTNSIHAAPMGLAKTISTVAVAKGATASTSTLTLIKGALKIMAWTKVKTTIVASAIILLVAGVSTVVIVKKDREIQQTEEHISHAGTTQIKITGADGMVITGFYIQNGQRITVSDSLPWSVIETNISQFEFHALNPEKPITVALVYDGNGAHSKMTQILDSKFPSMQGQVANGLIVMKLPK